MKQMEILSLKLSIFYRRSVLLARARATPHSGVDLLGRKLQMKIRDLVGRDVRIALNATSKRRAVTYGPLAGAMVVSVILWRYVPGWTWAVLTLGDLATFAFVGSHWANQDALRRDTVAKGRENG
jgi:hypothetical protein